MGRHNGIKRRIRRNRSALKYRRQLTVILSVVVVFLMVWALVLPAKTLTKKEAKKQGGVELSEVQRTETQEQDKKPDEDNAEPDKPDTDEASADQENTSESDDVKYEKTDSKKERSKDQKADRKDEGIDGKKNSGKENSFAAGKLKFYGTGFDLEAAYGKKAKLPEDTEIAVKEIGRKAEPKKYEKYYDKALEAIEKEMGRNKVSRLSFARFYDITLTSDGEEIEPEDKVKVTISYDTGLKAKEADHVKVVHFTEDEKTGELDAEVLESTDVDATIKSGKMEEASFDAESFSVYAVVYTVDAETNGQLTVDADGIATISSVAGDELPEEAEGSAAVLAGKESSDAVAAVKEAANTSDKEQETVYYQAFDISLDGVNTADYKEGFKVQVNLPKVINGKDFHLYHIHEGKTEEIDLTTVGKTDGKTGLESVSGFEFVTDGFSEFVLSYTVEYSHANYNYVIPVGETVTLQDVLDFVRYTVPDGVQVENVEFSGNPTEPGQAQILTVAKSGNDWNLTAETNFTGDEELTVTFSDGTTLTIAMYCEETHIDGGHSYILYTVENDGIHVLKADGSTEVFASLSDIGKDRLGSEYQWSFYYVYTQYDEGDHLDHVYYFIRPLADKSNSIALNHPGAELVQEGANNIAVLPQGNIGEGGFVFHGYNNVELGMNNGSFAGVTGDGSTIHIWQQEPLPTYEFTVISDDYRMGNVTTTGTALTKQDKVEQRQPDGSYKEVTGTVTYYLAETNNAKKNRSVITATPASHTNPQGQNKWEFDYWDLDGVKLEGVGPTIQPGQIDIPKNGSVLTAHFKQKSSTDYVVPPGEKQGSSFEDMTQWLNEMLSRDLPLDKSGCKKTAEVYDYENRIYRVDLTSKASLTTLDGMVDLGFMLDVSNSMKFPSNLQPIQGLSNVDVRTVNGGFWDYGDNSYHNQDNSLTRGQTYYIISDPHHTSTVYRIEFRYGTWQFKDASSNDSAYASIGSGSVFKGAQDSTNDNHYHYQMYSDADSGHDRFYYLTQSLANTWDALEDIQSKIQVASGNNNPKIRIAYNTFNKYLNYDGSNSADHPTGNGYGQNFAPIEANINFSYSNGGGTRPDRALNDAANRWSWGSGKRYAILITDGAPQGARTDLGESSNYSTDQIIANKVNPAVAALKAKGVTLITIGLSMENVDGGRIMLYDIADDVNGKHMFFSAEKGSDLGSILLQIVQTIMEDATVTGKVTDTVGDAFYAVDKDTGRPLKANDKIDLEGNLTTDTSKPYGVIQADGCTIVWENQDFTHEGWQGTVYVKAKEDLLGGNAVKTNSGDAKIEAQGYKMPDSDTVTLFDTTQTEKLKTLTIDDLKTPRVNVNELGFLWNDTEWTVYLGTQVDPLKQLKELWNNIRVTEVVKEGCAVDTDGDDLPDKGKDAAGNSWYPLSPNSVADNREDEGASTDKETFLMADLIKKLAEEGSYDWWDYTNHTPKWDTFLTQAMSSDGIVIPYHEYGLNDNGNIKITLAKDIKPDEEDDLLGKSPHSTTVTGDGVEKYTLTVLYSPDYNVLPEGQGGGSTEDFHTGTYGTTYQGHAAGTETSTNTHTINVYAEPLDILKTDDQGDAVPGAEFKLYRVAKDGETGESLTSYDPSLTGSYYCISTATSGTDGIVHLAPDDITTPKHTIPVAEGQTAQDLLVPLEPDETYYLVESSVPDGYKSDTGVKTVRVVVGPDLFTQLDKTTPVEESDISGTPPRPTTAYNWDEGVTIVVKDLGDGVNDPNQARLVNHETREGVTLKDADNNNRTYMLRSDSNQSVVTEIEILNGKVVDIRIQKTDMEGEGLAGAVFRLQAVGNDGHSESDVEGVTGIGTVTKTIDGQEQTFTSAFETTGGEQTFNDLTDGTYRLYEAYIPPGYIKTFDYIQFTIENRVMKEVSVVSGDADKIDFTPPSDSNLALLKIKNTPGTPLPHTGGPGTTLFYLLGALLTLGGGILLVSRRRMVR